MVSASVMNYIHTECEEACIALIGDKFDSFSISGLGILGSGVRVRVREHEREVDETNSEREEEGEV